MKRLCLLVLYFLVISLFLVLFVKLSFGYIFRIQNNTSEKIYYHLYQRDHNIEEYGSLPIVRAEGELKAFKHIDLGSTYPLVRYFIIWTSGHWDNEWAARTEFDLTDEEVKDDEVVIIELNWIPFKIKIEVNGELVNDRPPLVDRRNGNGNSNKNNN